MTVSKYKNQKQQKSLVSQKGWWNDSFLKQKSLFRVRSAEMTLLPCTWICCVPRLVACSITISIALSIGTRGYGEWRSLSATLLKSINISNRKKTERNCVKKCLSYSQADQLANIFFIILSFYYKFQKLGFIKWKVFFVLDYYYLLRIVEQ